MAMRLGSISGRLTSSSRTSEILRTSIAKRLEPAARNFSSSCLRTSGGIVVPLLRSPKGYMTVHGAKTT